MSDRARSVAIMDDVPRFTLVDTNYLADISAEVDAAPPPPIRKKKKLSKAEKKEKKRQKQIEFRKLEMRDNLRRELELSRKSAEAGKETWNEMCREVKIEEFRTELVQWNVKTQRLMQNKDETILRLIDTMDETQEMHQRSYARQIEIIDFFINSYNIILDAQRNIYNSQATDIITDFQEELNARRKVFGEFQTNCENIMHCSNMITEEEMRNDLKVFFEKKDDRVNTEIEKRYRLRDATLVKMKELQKTLLDFVSSIQNSTLDVRKYEKIQWLMDRQRLFLNESVRLTDLEMELTHKVSELQRNLLLIEVNAQRRINDLRLEMEYFRHVRRTIEQNMENNRRTTFVKLRTLTSEAFEVKKLVRKHVKFGELLLSISATARKLQTEAEKVTRWGDIPQLKDKLDEVEEMKLLKKLLDKSPKKMHPLNKCRLLLGPNYKGKVDIEEEPSSEPSEVDKIFKLQVLHLEAHTDMTEEELIEQMRTLKYFWRRQAIAETQNLILNDEQRILKEENQKYIDFIKSMSKTEEAEELLSAIHYTCLLPETPPTCQQHSYRYHRTK